MHINIVFSLQNSQELPSMYKSSLVFQYNLNNKIYNIEMATLLTVDVYNHIKQCIHPRLNQNKMLQ